MLFLQLAHIQRFQPIPLIPVHTSPTLFKKNASNKTPYVKLSYREAADLQNFYYLYTGSDKSKTTLEKLTNQIRKTDCVKLCIINLYDDLRAYHLDMERITITIPKIMEDWNKKNYVYVAQHYLGYSGPDAHAPFSYYPFKDWYYQKSRR